MSDQTNDITKNNWRTVRFGDVVRNVNSSVKDALEQGIERFVGLEHLDPESLHIKRWGNVADGTSFTRKFASGQVLFGKRRAYQRKAAVADFDGICSGDILVFEPKTDDLLPELLPFVVQSDGFFEHALGTSAGSLSPRTKWSDLARYEFALPPKDEQRSIAEILWAADKVIQKFKTPFEQATALSSLYIEESIQKSEWANIELGDILLGIQYGLSSRAGEKTIDSVPLLRIPNVVEGGLDLSDLVWIVLSDSDKEKYSVRKGDILIVRTNGNPNYVGRCIVIKKDLPEMAYASYLIRLRFDESKTSSSYINSLLKTDYMRKTLNHEIRSSAGNYNLNTVGIKRQRIPLPSIEQQNQIVGVLETIENSKFQLENHLINSQNLKNDLIRKLLFKNQ